jgi:hypothetical protein
VARLGEEDPKRHQEREEDGWKARGSQVPHGCKHNGKHGERERRGRGQATRAGWVSTQLGFVFSGAKWAPNACPCETRIVLGSRTAGQDSIQRPDGGDDDPPGKHLKAACRIPEPGVLDGAHVVFGGPERNESRTAWATTYSKYGLVTSVTRCPRRRSSRPIARKD